MISGVMSIFGHMGIIGESIHYFIVLGSESSLKAVWGLRTSAVYNKNKFVTGFLGLLGVGIIVLLIVRAPFNRCYGPVTLQWCE